MMPVSELRLDTPIPTPDHVVVGVSMNSSIETPTKLRLWKNSCLMQPGQPLRGGVVRASSLRAHGTRQIALPADADPFGPPVVAAAITVNDGLFAVLERGARVQQHAGRPSPALGLVPIVQATGSPS